jgi:hypothetical protein
MGELVEGHLTSDPINAVDIAMKRISTCTDHVWNNLYDP